MKNHNHLNKANRVIIGGCNKKTKLLLINVFSQTMKIGDIIVIPIIDIESLKELKGQLNDKKFKTSLNLIQTYKSLSISEGIRLDPNNPVFLLKGDDHFLQEFFIKKVSKIFFLSDITSQLSGPIHNILVHAGTSSDIIRLHC